MREVLERLKEVVPDLSWEYLCAMSSAVDERAADLNEYAEPDDYDEPDGKERHVQTLVDAAKVLGALARIVQEAEGRDEPGTGEGVSRSA